LCLASSPVREAFATTQMTRYSAHDFSALTKHTPYLIMVNPLD
jgi:hypothetical protein